MSTLKNLNTLSLLKDEWFTKHYSFIELHVNKMTIKLLRYLMYYSTWLTVQQNLYGVINNYTIAVNHKSHCFWIVYCINYYQGVNSVPSNLAVAYHGVTWDTKEKGFETVHDPDINLVCQFDRLPDQSLYYDVTWYVDDNEVLTNQTVSSSSSDLALLTGSQMLAKGKKANSMVFQLSFNDIQNKV